MRIHVVAGLRKQIDVMIRTGIHVVILLAAVGRVLACRRVLKPEGTASAQFSQRA